MINTQHRAIAPGDTKLHLATWNSDENPLDIYLAGEFEEWQRWQNKRNFERNYVLSLINLSETNQWLFAGVYKSNGCEWVKSEGVYYYDLKEIKQCSEFNGRLVATFSRPGRQSYLNAENWSNSLLISEIKPERISIADFPGFKQVDLSRKELNAIVKQNLESWRVALSNIAGVYIISDTATGSLYIGSATGEGGIWSRWCQYANTGHGGNKDIKKLLAQEGNERADAFRYSILEIADLHTSNKEILARESHWKRVLLSREFGLNAN